MAEMLYRLACGETRAAGMEPGEVRELLVVEELQATAKEMSELKPCPFEHHYPCQPVQVLQVDTVLNDGVFRYAVFCLHCDARGPVCETRAAAIAAWNRRSEGKPESEEVGE